MNRGFRSLRLVFSKHFALIGCLLTTIACSDSGDTSDTSVPDSYVFESRFQEGASSVSYSGQIFRHVLIEDLVSYIASLDERIEGDANFDASKVEGALLSYYEFDSDVLGNNEILLETDPQTEQKVYDDITTGKDLASKMAGQDGDGEHDHKDWSKEFVGWKDETIQQSGGRIKNPDGLMRAFLATIAANAQAQADGASERKGLKVHQTAAGQDLEELVEKFLLGAIAFSQAADDYLDEELQSDNVEETDEGPYSELEHAWDEAFGYFGASRAYLSQSDDEIAAGELFDENGDDKIDLTSEYNFGASVNAAKRDAGSASGTDFTKEAMTAFLTGRALISDGTIGKPVQEQARIAVKAWEKSLAATAVHYINETLDDMDAFDTKDYSFDDHAQHWSELKGFALCFQFNPHSPLSDGDFAKLHDLIGDAPVLSGDKSQDQNDFEDSLRKARQLLQDAYDFEDDDVENW